jgi:hypothetical protein
LRGWTRPPCSAALLRCASNDELGIGSGLRHGLLFVKFFTIASYSGESSNGCI